MNSWRCTGRGFWLCGCRCCKVLGVLVDVGSGVCEGVSAFSFVESCACSGWGFSRPSFSFSLLRSFWTYIRYERAPSTDTENNEAFSTLQPLWGRSHTPSVIRWAGMLSKTSGAACKRGSLVWLFHLWAAIIEICKMSILSSRPQHRATIIQATSIWGSTASFVFRVLSEHSRPSQP